MTALALLSDIHGNLPALEAVAAELARCKPDAVYVLGDMVNGCAWPAECLDFLLAAGWPMLLGNHDDAVLQLGAERMELRYADRERYAFLWWTHKRLRPAHLALLAALPLQYTVTGKGGPALRLFHGVPGNFLVGIRPNASDSWIRKRLEGVSEAAVAAGHTHAAMVRRSGRWLVVNCGSVGAPYDGDYRASYAWLTAGRDGWHAEIRRVSYDVEAVAAGYRGRELDRDGGVLGKMFHRSVMTGLPWVSDFHWWLRNQPEAVTADLAGALAAYDASHGPGNWAFPE